MLLGLSSLNPHSTHPGPTRDCPVCGHAVHYGLPYTEALVSVEISEDLDLCWHDLGTYAIVVCAICGRAADQERILSRIIQITHEHIALHTPPPFTGGIGGVDGLVEGTGAADLTTFEKVIAHLLDLEQPHTRDQRANLLRHQTPNEPATIP